MLLTARAEKPEERNLNNVVPLSSACKPHFPYILSAPQILSDQHCVP